MLRQRVITALVLMAVLLPALFAASPWPFALLTLVFIGAAGWEWGRLNGAGGALSLAMGLVVALLGLAALWGGWAERAPSAVWWFSSALWVFGGALALKAGPAAWPRIPQALRWLIGIAVLWTAWLAMAHARSVGVNFILSVFCLTWMADIAAYFGGRRFGRRKLAPTISPGKSWEGVWSGLTGVLLLAVAWAMADARQGWLPASLYTGLGNHLGVAGAAAALALLTAASVAGDLVESLVKRAAGAKDSSRLLPGHGGVLDRVDALLPVFPLALALHSL